MTNTEIEKTMGDAPQLSCSICGGAIAADGEGWTGGHNAEPINDGRCCHDCYKTVVVPKRWEKIGKVKHK